MSVREIHVIDRTETPESVIAQVALLASNDATIIDLSTGRVDAVSVISDSQKFNNLWRLILGTEYADRIAYTSQDAYVAWIAEIGDQPILDGKSLKEWFVYNDEVSLWWFTKTATKGQISSPYRWLFYSFGVIDELIDNGEIPQGAVWHFWVQDDATGEVFRQYIGSRGRVVVHASEDEPSPEAALTTLRRRIMTPLLHVANALKLNVETRKERRRIVRELATRKSPIHLMVTEFSRSWRPISDDESFDDRVRTWDFYMGGLPWDLTKLGLDVRWLNAASTTREFRRWREEGVRAQDLPDASALATLPLEKISGILSTHLSWCRSFDHLFLRNRAHHSLRYRGVDMSHWIVKDFADLCLGSAVSTLIKIEQYRRAAVLARPRTVLYRDEMFRSGRQISAGVSGLATRVGIQHGIINREATVYRFHPNEIASGDPGDALVAAHCPVPDVFASFGEFTRELFEEWGGYPSSRVIPTGGARHDHLVRRLASVDDAPAIKSTLRSKLGLPDDVPVVLLCTQRRADAGRWFEMIVGTLKTSWREVFVAVKTHHYHGGDEDIRYVAEENAFDNYRIFSVDTYDLIAASDVVVGGASTIIIEACLLDRPAITVTSNDSFQTYPYQSEGLGIAVSDDHAMERVLATLLHDSPGQTAGIKVPRPILCTRHLWNHDAGAARRLAEVLLADR